MDKILIICAHPDDDILGCGGLMAKYSKKGTDFRVVFIAEGSSCRFNSDELISDKTKEIIEFRNNCGIRALQILGVSQYHFYNLPCGRLDTIPLIEINKIIENEIKSYKPTSIFTHSENDTNNDHCIVFKSTLIASRPGSEIKVNNLYSFEILSSSEWKFTSSFEPNYFEEITQKELDQKWKAMAEYETEIKEFPFPRSPEGFATLAKYRGMQSGVKYAEAFRIIRKIQSKSE